MYNVYIDICMCYINMLINMHTGNLFWHDIALIFPGNFRLKLCKSLTWQYARFDYIRVN